LDVPKDLPDEVPANTLVAKNLSMNDVADAGLGEGQPNILEDSDEEEAAAQQAKTPDTPAAGTVPNFKGMTLRAVLEQAHARGIRVQPDGSGVARVQFPAPGSVLHQGERIRVQFAR